MPAKAWIMLSTSADISATRHIWDCFRDLAKLTTNLGVSIKMNDPLLVSVFLTLV